MRNSWLTRGWTAAGALVAAALLASLPTATATSPSASATFDTAAAAASTPTPTAAVTAPVETPVNAPAVVAPAARTPAPAASRSAAPRAVAAAPVAASGAGTWAFIVGIDDYPGSANDLKAAVADANAVQQAVVQLGAPLSQILTVRDGEATAAAIRSGLDWLTANAGPDAVAVFFYAGHVTKVRNETEALVGTDGREVQDAEVAQRLAPLRAKQAWLAIAGCFGGGFTEAMAPGRVLTGAAPSNALAYENNQLPRSYMVEYMVQQAIIEGKAADSVQSAYAYAIDALARDYPQRQPVQYDATDRPLDLRPQQQQQQEPAPNSGGTSSPPTSTPPRDCGLFCG